VSGEIMAAAIELGRYFRAHAMAAFAAMQADPNLVAAKRVLSWIERKRIERFTEREAFRAVTGQRIPDMVRLRGAFAVLEERGHIRQEAPDPRLVPGRQGGRPAGASYEVNPRAFGYGRNP
jgi:hypothetical protein